MIVDLLLATVLQLNGTWEFRFEEGKTHHEVANPRFAATDSIVVPGCFDAMPKWFMKRGTGLYRRRFTLDHSETSVWLVIDGLGLYGRFWIDGQEVGTDDLPWSRVELPLGTLAAGAHELVAAVDNRFDWKYQKLVRTYYDFHCWGGFFHGVSLSFDNRRLLVRTRDYRLGEVEVEAVNFENADFDAILTFDGANVVRTTFRRGRSTVRVPAFRLWSPERPNLHSVEMSGVSARFGIRTFEAKNRGFYLNGERIFLKGANRHEQQLQLGASTPDGYMLGDIQRLKSMGGNFFRGAHYPQSQRFLELCDENGVMIWEESLGWGNGQKYTQQNGVNELEDPDFIEKQVRQTRLMVRNSFNHPSVVIFGFLNEQESSLPSAKELSENLISVIRAEDSGRLVTFACNRLETDICHELTDFIAINTYPGSINSPPGVLAELRDQVHNLDGHGIDWAAAFFRRKYPEKTIMISEIGTGGDYGWDDPSAPMRSEDFLLEYNSLVAEAVYGNADIAGLAYWQFFDTRTCWRDCGHDGMKPNAMSRAGLFNWCRQPKRIVAVVSDWFCNRTPANMRRRGEDDK